MERPPAAVLVPATVVHVVLAALVWRDVARRPPGSLRGGRTLWRVLSALNTSGSLAYVLVGRR